MEKLIIVSASNPTSDKFLLTSNSVVIGRQPSCDLILNNNAVSREHAKIEKRAGEWYVEDLQSRNGVWLNGSRIPYAPVKLKNGDSLLIGDATITFYSDGASAQAKTQSLDSLKESELAWGDDELSPQTIRSQCSLGDRKDSSKSSSERDYKREVQLLEDRLRLLLELARSLGKAEDVRDLTPRFLKCILQLFPQADAACLLAPETETQPGEKERWELVNYARRDETKNEKFRVSRAIIRHVVTSRSAIISDYAPSDVRFEASESIMRSSIQSVMAAPLYDAASDKLIGVIQIDARSSGQRFGQDDLQLLVTVANQVAVYWENQHYRDAIVKEKIALRELQVANQVQRGFLPSEPPKVANYEFFDYYRPAKFVGGDYFDYIPLPGGRIAVIVGDVSGKGLSASLLMAKLSSETRYGLLLENSYADAMKRLNDVFTENHWGDRFITLLLVILTPATGELRVFNAGHLYPCVSKPNGEVVNVGEGYNSFPLGIVPGADFPEFVYHLQEGEAVSIMSDGFPDAQSSDSVAFGEARIMRELSNPDADDAETLGKRLVSKIKKFSDSSNQTDDQCLVVFRRIPSDCEEDVRATGKSVRMTSSDFGLTGEHSKFGEED